MASVESVGVFGAVMLAGTVEFYAIEREAVTEPDVADERRGYRHRVDVNARPSDPGQHSRQQVYLRALKTFPHLEIHRGHFLSHPIDMPLASPLVDGPYVATVIKIEEKGSDVNLASYLLLDAFEDDYEAAVVITNDSYRIRLHRIVGTDHERWISQRRSPCRHSRKLFPI